jgi:hypothetical protein
MDKNENRLGKIEDQQLAAKQAVSHAWIGVLINREKEFLLMEREETIQRVMD